MTAATEAIESPVHQIMPPLTRAERDALRVSIERFGVILPIVVDQHGNIIDGHNRHEIAAEVDQPCPREVFVVRDAEHAAEVAQTLNIDRRHVNELTRKRIAQSLSTSGHSLRAIAGALGVSHVTVRSDLGVDCPPDVQVLSDLTPDQEPGPVAEPTPERVTGTDGKSYPRGSRNWTVEEEAELLSLADSGATHQELADHYGMVRSAISSRISRARNRAPEPEFSIDSPPAPMDRSATAVAARIRLIRELADANHSTRQIASMLGLSEGGTKTIIRNEEISVPADELLGNTRHLDSNRIVSETISGLEGFVFGLTLADCTQLDPDQVPAWSESLRSSIKSLNRLLKEMNQ